MTDRLTDRVAIKLALGAAIEWERSLIDAWNGDDTEPAVQYSRELIAAWRRVLARYYADPETLTDKFEKRLDSMKSVPITTLMKGAAADRAD